MGRPLTEQKVLKRLGIEDFRHLTKDKVITMASMLDKMDPEVAKKAVEQFPDFSETMKKILYDYKDSLDKAQAANAESVKSFYDSCDMTINALQQQLEREELTFEDRKYIIDKMLEINRMKGDKDSENKRFIATMALFGVTAVGIVAGALSSALGGKTKIEMQDDDNLDD